MHYLVEARYINNQPRLRILDRAKGTVFIEWNMQMVENMIEEGDFKREEFLQPERYGMKLLVKNLFLLACSEKMKKESTSTSVLDLHVSPRQAPVSKAPGITAENPSRPRQKPPRQI